MENRKGLGVIVQVIGVVLVFLCIVNFWTTWFSRLWVVPATIIYCVGLAMSLEVVPITEEEELEEELGI